jgi:glycosyltransferase involved in cell wall biosynthesis
MIVKARLAEVPVGILDERTDLDDLHDLELLRDQQRGNYPHTNSVLRTLPSTSLYRAGDMVTVIIPTLNEEKTLTRTIESIRTQHCRCEIVVVDGGSIDRTLELANQLADRVIVTSLRGRQHQENIAANSAKGDILLFLHADTVVPPTILQSIVTTLHDRTIVAGGAHLIYSPPDRFRYKALSAFRDVGSRILRISGMGSAFFIRRDAFQLLGGFDEEMNEEAVDMCKRLHALGKHVMLDEVIRSSARRYEQTGFARTIFAWMFTIALSYIGIRAVSIEKYVWRVVR